MDTVLFFGFAAGYAVLLGWGARLAARHGWVTAANLVLLVVVGLVYDNLVLASGGYVGEGAALEALNGARFWVHAFLTPLLVVWSWHAARRAGARWARTRAAVLVTLLVTVGLVVLEIVSVLAGLRLEPRVEYGVLSYGDAAGSGGPPAMVLVVAAALVAAGVVVWRRQRWIWLLLAALVMVVGSAVPVPLESGAVTNLFELVLLAAVLATKARQDALEAHEGGAVGPVARDAVESDRR